MLSLSFVHNCKPPVNKAFTCDTIHHAFAFVIYDAYYSLSIRRSNPYHPWICGYDFHHPLENEEDAQDHECLEGVCLGKEHLYAMELVDKHLIRMGFVPIRCDDSLP
jgi:hypothetical protein